MVSHPTPRGAPITKLIVRRLVPQSVRRQVWASVVDHPMLSRAYYYLDSEMRGLRLTRRTSLLIDGFMRSANTYAVFAFQHANGPDVRLAHHLHRPLVFQRAAAWGIPALVTVRAPQDVVTSLVQFEPTHSIAGTLTAYIDFYARLEGVLDHLVVADFGEVTTDFGRVVERVNSRYGTSFLPYVKSVANDQAVFREVERFSARYFGTEGFESKVGRPSATRMSTPELLVGLDARERELLGRAAETYRTTVSRRGSVGLDDPGASRDE